MSLAVPQIFGVVDYSDSRVRVQGYTLVLDPLLSKSLTARAKRGFMYFNDQEQSKWRKLANVALPVLTCTSIGSAAGAGISYVATGGSLDSVKKGAKWGGALGLNIGLVSAVWVTYPHYQKWKQKAIDSGIFPVFVKFYADDPRLKDFICTLSEEVYLFPVKDKYGHTWEKERIETWILKNGDSPNRCGQLTLDDLVPDYEMLARMFRVIEPMLYQESRQTQGLPKEIVEGMIALAKDLKRQRRHMFNYLKAQLENKFTNHKIDVREYGNEMQRLAHIFSDPPNAPTNAR